MNTRPRNWVISCLSGKRCHALLSSERNVKTDTERDSFRKKMNKISEDNAEREDRRCHVAPAFGTLVPETPRDAVEPRCARKGPQTERKISEFRQPEMGRFTRIEYMIKLMMIIPNKVHEKK